MSLIAELQRRNVIRMAGLYLVGAWLIVQVAGTVLEMEDAMLRRYDTPQEYIDDVSISRLYVGVHYRFSVDASQRAQPRRSGLIAATGW